MVAKTERHHESKPKDGFFKKHRAILWLLLGLVSTATSLVAYIYYHQHLTRADKSYAIGSSISVTGNKVPVDIKASVVTSTSIPVKDFVLAAPVVSITPSGPLPAPITLRFKLNRAVSNRTPVVIATRETQNDKWSYITPTISSDGLYATVQTDHLSIYEILEGAINFDQSFNQAIVNDLTGIDTEKATKPTCQNEAAALQDSYSISSSSGDTVYWCFGVEGGKRVLKVVNNRSYPIDLTRTVGLSLASDGHVSADLSQLAKIASLGAYTVVFPGDEADFNVNLNLNQATELGTSWNGGASSLDLLQSGLEALSAIVSRIDGGQAASSSRTLTIMSKVLQDSDCFDAYKSGDEAKMLVDCLSDTAEKGLLSAPKDYVLSLVQAFGSVISSTVSEVTGLINDPSDAVIYSISIQHGTPSSQDDSASSASTAPGCPSGSPTATVGNVSVTTLNASEDAILLTITGAITNATSTNITINDIGFYPPGYNPDLAPIDPLVLNVGDSLYSSLAFSNNSATINARSSVTYKAKESLYWDTISDGPIPNSLVASLSFPPSDSQPPEASWTWAGNNIPDSCQPTYPNYE